MYFSLFLSNNLKLKRSFPLQNTLKMAVAQYSDPKSIPFVLAGEAWKKEVKNAVL